MKKILALLLCISMVCGLFACSGETANKDNEQPDAQTEQTEQEEQTEQSEEAEQTEKTVYSESIPLGGNARECEIEGPAYGNYTELTNLEGFGYEGCTSTHVYADETCDTPYIAVYRWTKDDRTLEDEAKSISEYWNGGIYEIVDSADGEAGKYAYICCSHEMNGQYYYLDMVIFEDGDEFVEIDTYAKSVEIRLGESNTYLWVPAGYTDLMNDDEIAHGSIFCGEYDESYYFPSIWVGTLGDGYEYAKWFWSSIYPEGFPYTEEEFNALTTPDSDDFYLSDEYNEKYFGAFGYEILYSAEYEKDGAIGEHFILRNGRDDDDDTDLVIETADGQYFEIWTTTSEQVAIPYITRSLFNSLHTK